MPVTHKLSLAWNSCTPNETSFPAAFITFVGVNLVNRLILIFFFFFKALLSNCDHQTTTDIIAQLLEFLIFFFFLFFFFFFLFTIVAENPVYALYNLGVLDGVCGVLYGSYNWICLEILCNVAL